MPDPTWFLVYGTVADNGTISLTIVGDGRVLGGFTPSPYSAAPEARFEARRSPEACARWRAMLLGSGYRDAPRRAVLQPGEQAVTFGISEDGGLPALTAFALDEVPDGPRPLRAELDALVAALRRRRA
jgi:hypothetical protein